MRYANDAILVIEVLSESTEGVDRREKRRNYALLPSLREYVLVAQEERRVEVFRKTDSGDWELQVLSGDDTVILASLDLTVPLATIYREAGID
jgi:Uma2 family endonuclease